MSYNNEFEDMMSDVNDIGKGYGFKNGIEWAARAQRVNEISYDRYKQYENAHNLRVRLSHGNARDISVSYETYQIVKKFKNDIIRSNIRNNRSNFSGGSCRDASWTRNVKAKLPPGEFCAQPYVKEFYRKSKTNGEEYYFKFKIYRETNYLDDGYGGKDGFGYFIHIIDAPYLNYATDRLHQFHIISTRTDYHICWNKVIDNFEEANAVMFVWVNRYCDLIDIIKEDSSISESQLNARANKKNILPIGTFRANIVDKKNKFYNKKEQNKKMQRKTIKITEGVYDQIMSVLGHKKPELGGMLGYTENQDLIDTYIFDSGARVNSVEYSPNIDYLNGILEKDWEEKRIHFGGFVHSHPGDFNRLSYADVEYSQRIMEAFDMTYMFMPIVTSSFAYKTSITGYIVHLNGRVERVNISVVKEKVKDGNKVLTNKKESETTEQEFDGINPELLKMIESGFDEMDKKTETKPVDIQIVKKDNLDQNYTFARISSIIDVDYMNECTVIGIGCGGSKNFYEGMARMGVGNFYLMDGDKSSYSNIASQNGYISEVGLYKPELIKNRLLDINKDVNVVAFNCMLDDTIDDETLEKEIISKIDTKKAVICAFTDNFFAQARVSRIALKYGIPFISGQHYYEGVISELIFWYPGVTKYSMREITKSRYEAYENGFTNDVTSVGSPIFNTTRLNALCEKIALGMLLYSKYPAHVYCSFLNYKNDKNLILIKQRYIEESHPLYDLFENGINSLFDEVSWIHPDSLEDLTNTPLEEGTVQDTRTIFKK